MSEPSRWRKWRRLLAGVAVVVLLIAAYAQLQSTSFQRRAAKLALGQTVDEVRVLMGEPEVGNYPKDGIFFSPALTAYKSANQWWEKLTGRRDFRRVRKGWMEESSVSVIFREGRLVYIRRGLEVIQSPDFIVR